MPRTRRLRLVVGAAIALSACQTRGGSGGRSDPDLEAPSASAPATALAREEPARVDAGPAAERAPEGMNELPAALYMMGTRLGAGDPEEHPMHEVLVAAFFLDRTEVTTEAYRACVDAGRCKPARVEPPFCNAGAEGRGNHPINCVDHDDAAAFCAFAGKRLPSEAEWEYAASGGDEKRKFSWGEEEPDRSRACYWHEGSCPVGSFAPGAFGLFDMSGNVWEWTSTWWGPYPQTGQPEIEPPATNRVYRGGSWSRRFPRWLRTTLRNRYPPEKWSASLGMRCARTRVPVSCPADGEARGDACVRVRGTPRCEPAFGWNGSGCVLSPSSSNGTVAAATPRNVPASAAVAVKPGAPAETPETDTIGRSRTTQFDADCLAHYPGKTAAYAVTGGTFHTREPVVRASGCTKRDVGRTWTSVCCPE